MIPSITIIGIFSFLVKEMFELGYTSCKILKMFVLWLRRQLL